MTRATTAPQAKSPASASSTAGHRAVAPSRYGSTGSSAPSANEPKDETAATSGEGRSSGSMPELLAGVDLQRLLGVAGQLHGDLAGQRRLDAAGDVELGELLHLVDRVLAQLLTLDVEFGEDQFALRGDGGVFAGRHREGAGREARQAGDHDGLRGDGAARHAGHQREVGDEPVHRTEDGRPQPSAVDVAVGVVVAVRGVQWCFDVDDGHAAYLPICANGRRAAPRSP